MDEIRAVAIKREAYATGSQFHHAIPWENSKFNHQEHDLVKLAKVDLFSFGPNIKPVAGHMGPHADAYHEAVRNRLTAAYQKLPELTQAVAEKALKEVLVKIWRDIASGKLPLYENRSVKLIGPVP